MANIITQSNAEDIAMAVGLDPEEAIYPKYSGRGMYGRECFGIVGSVSDLVGFVTEAVRRDERGEEAVTEFVQYIEDVSVDNMGREYIFYWQGVEVTDE